MSPSSQLEQDKRVRREIANSNERRRMQSINTGFQSLKILIPHSCGEKLSKACILQRAADHIKALENEKLKLQSQNEQFRILIKSFQIDSTSVLQGKRRLSTNESNETAVLLLSTTDESKHWQSIEKSYRSISPTSPPTTSDPTYMIVKQTPAGQRCYKTNSVDQNNESSLLLLERCQLRTQSVDTNHTVSRRNLQTIVEAIRHVEGDDALANINPSSQISSAQQQEDLPAQIKAMINEKFQTNNKNLSTATQLYQQATSYDIDLHQRPPKKRKITYNESDDNPLDRAGKNHEEFFIVLIQ